MTTLLIVTLVSVYWIICGVSVIKELRKTTWLATSYYYAIGFLISGFFIPFFIMAESMIWILGKIDPTMDIKADTGMIMIVLAAFCYWGLALSLIGPIPPQSAQACACPQAQLERK